MRSYFLDKRTDTVGELMGHEAGSYLLRPVRGGREWVVPPEHGRPATPAEKLTAGVRAVNADTAAHAAVMREGT
jgi:hypothetical protein